MCVLQPEYQDLPNIIIIINNIISHNMIMKITQHGNPIHQPVAESLSMAAHDLLMLLLQLVPLMVKSCVTTL